MNRLNKLFFIIFLLISCSKESVKYTLNIKINPTDGGYVNISNGEFSSGEQISIKATASESYTFENWSGDEIGSSNIISVTMDENKTLTANFKTLFILIQWHNNLEILNFTEWNIQL